MLRFRTLIAAAIAVSAVVAWPRAAAAQFPPEARGRVVVAGGDEPVAGARVHVFDSAVEVTTGADGSFLLRGLPPGEHTLVVSALGFRSDSVTVRLENGRVTRAFVQLRRIPTTLAPFELEALTATVRASSARSGRSATVLDRDRIRESGASDLGSLLRTLPGVTVTRRGGPGSPATASIRGSSADQVLVLVDGLPLNSLLTGEADLSTVPLSAVDRIELIPGSAAVEFGPGAVGGVVLVESVPAGGREGSIHAEFGTLGRSTLGIRWGGAPFDVGGAPLSAVGHAEIRHLDGAFTFERPEVRGGGEEERLNAASTVTRLGGSASVDRDGLGIRGRTEWSRVERGMPGSVFQPTRSAKQEQERWSAQLSTDVERGSTTVTARLFMETQRAEFRDPDPPAVAPYDDRFDARGVGARAGATHLFGSVRLDGGAEWRSYEVEGTTLGEDRPDRVHTSGAWALLSWSGHRDGIGRLVARGGLRVDRHSLAGDTRLSPELSLAVERGRWTLRGSIRDAYSPPTLSDQFFQEGVLIRPNPDLRPEETEGEVEIGLGLAPLPLGSVEVEADIAAFWADVRGMILWFPDFRFVWSPENVDVRRRGLDLHVGLRLPSRQLGFDGRWSWSDVEYDIPALTGRVVYRPSHTAGLSVTAPIRGVRARIDTDYLGSRATVPGSELNTLEGSWRTDLQISRSMRLGTWPGEVAVGVENLSGNARAMLVDYPLPGRTWTLRVRVDRPPG